MRPGFLLLAILTATGDTGDTTEGATTINALFASYDWFTGVLTNRDLPLWLRIILAPFALVAAGIWFLATAVLSLGLLFVLAVGGIIVIGILAKLFGSIWGVPQ